MNVERWWKEGVLVRETHDGINILDNIGVKRVVHMPNGPLPSKRSITVPSKDWPLLLRPMKLLAQPDDKGLGDIVERTIGPVGGTAYKAWYLATFGKTCGCTKRKDNLNLRYPL